MAILVCVLLIVLYVLVVLAWLIILVTGRLPGFIAKYMQFALGWLVKFEALDFCSSRTTSHYHPRWTVLGGESAVP